MKLKPCPFCDAQLKQENRLNPDAKKNCGDLPFITFYVHPSNGCILSGMDFRGERLQKWQRRPAHEKEP